MQYYLLARTELQILFGEQQTISKDVLINATEDVADNLFASIMLVHRHLMVDDSNYRDLITYCEDYIDLCDNTFELGLSDEDKHMCAASIIAMKMPSVEEYPSVIAYLESYKDYAVDTTSTLWILREQIRYSLLAYYMQNLDHREKAKALLSMLKPNADEFKSRYYAYTRNLNV